jgi:hypothetical protein
MINLGGEDLPLIARTSLDASECSSSIDGNEA